jgi:hypothetical protein
MGKWPRVSSRSSVIQATYIFAIETLALLLLGEGQEGVRDLLDLPPASCPRVVILEVQGGGLEGSFLPLTVGSSSASVFSKQVRGLGRKQKKARQRGWWKTVSERVDRSGEEAGESEGAASEVDGVEKAEASPVDAMELLEEGEAVVGGGLCRCRVRR